MMWCLTFLLPVIGIVNGENACDVCQCKRAVVVCSGRNLTTIPDEIPLATIDLRLNRNNLKTIPDMKFAYLKKLQKLDLSYNYLGSLGERSFNGLSNLQELNLASNMLMLHPDNFSEKLLLPLQRLKKLWLNDNYGNYDPQKTAHYPDQTLKHLRMMEELHIDGLPYPFGPGFRSLSRLQKLSLSDNTHSCVMQELKNSTFQHVPHITHLNVSHCQILDTEPATFSPLKRLHDLDLSGNDRLGFKKVAVALQGLSGSPIKVLRLNQLYGITDFCSKLTYDLVHHLENTSLTELYLDSNGMIDLELKAVEKLPKSLEVLSMRDNRFIVSASWSHLTSMSSLRYIDVSDLNKWHPIDASSNNNIGRQSTVYIPLPLKLETAVLSRCYFRGGLNKAIVRNNSLKRFTADHGLLRFMNGSIRGLNDLEHIDLSHNVLKSVTSDALNGFPSLKSLNFSHNDIGPVLRNDTTGDLFGELKTLEILKISDNNINVLPHLIFRGITDVRIIDLSHNELEEFNVVISNLKNLQYLDLANNKIRYLPSEVRKSLDKVKLNLKSNPLSCTCEHIDFLKWMSARRALMKHLNTTQCKYSNGTNVNLISIDDIINYLNDHCADYKDILVTSFCLFFMIVFIMTSLILYRFRWRLRRLYYLGHKGPRRNLDCNYPEYIFDAFVCYADADRSFIIDEMIPELERKAGLKLCIHDRDFIPGTVIASNIVNAIQNSRKTIIVLSPSFLRSDWCNYEFNMAQTEGVARRENVVVAIMYKSVDFSKMPQNMSTMFIRYSFLKYNIDGDDNDIFWSNICDGIRTHECE